MTNSSHEANEIKRSNQWNILIQGDFNCELKFILERFIFKFSDTMTQEVIKLKKREIIYTSTAIEKKGGMNHK